MLLFAVSVFSEPSCRVVLNLNRSIHSWTQTLSAGECILLNATGRNSRFSYWVAISTKTIRVERYVCAAPGPGCALASVGESPDVQLFEKIRHAWLKYYFVALRNGTLFSLTYADLVDFRCERVIVNTSNPWTFVADARRPVLNRTCLLPCFPYPKTADVTWGPECADAPCGLVTIYHNGSKATSLVRNVTGPGATRVEDVEAPLLAVIEGNITSRRLTIDISSDSISIERDSVVDMPTEGQLIPPQVSSNFERDIYLLIGTALIALLLHIFTGFVFWKEYKQASFRSTGVTGSSVAMLAKDD
jgi:hypothetical protein